MNLKFFAVLALALLAAPAGLRAGEPSGARENPTGPLTLRQALRLTVRQNPELAAAASSVRAAEGRRVQAGLPPNPSLFTEADNLVGSGSFREGKQAESTIQLSQLVELGGKRAARVGGADSGRELASYDHESKRLELLVKTTKTFLETLLIQRRVALAEETAKLAEDLVPAIQRRVEAGAANSVEATRAQNTVATARIEVQQALRDLGSVRLRLATGWGERSAKFTVAVGNLDQTAAPPAFATLARRLGLNPAVARFPAEIAQREAGIRQARAEAVPDVTVALGPRYLAGSGDTTVRLNVSLPLPLFNRNQGNLQEAEAELQRTGHLQAATTNQLTVALNDAYRALLAARQEIDALRDTLLPGSEAAFRQINEGYEAGRYGLLDLLDTRRTLNAARLQLLNAQGAYHQALADIEGLTGQVRQAPAPTGRPTKIIQR